LAVCDWTNAQAGLVGVGNPLEQGCFLAPPPRSPASGAWALVSRVGGGQPLVAEDTAVTTARMQWDVYCGDEVAGEAAATGIAAAVEDLNGSPVPAGTVRILVSDNLSGPVYVPQPADASEPYLFQVQADLVLAPN
jgi:hypothetical protein